MSLRTLLIALVLVTATGCIVFYHRSRLLALVLVGIAGLIVSAAFVYLSAHDLVLTLAAGAPVDQPVRQDGVGRTLDAR